MRSAALLLAIAPLAAAGPAPAGPGTATPGRAYDEAVPVEIRLPGPGRAVEADGVRVYRRSESEVQVSDVRPETGFGVHRFDDVALRSARELGVRVLRITMYWSHVEPTAEEGRYEARELARWDRITRTAEEAGIELLVVVHQPPPGTSFARRGEAYRRFARFVGDMAERYPSVDLWQLWNEVDTGFTDLFGAGRPGNTARESGRMYGEMLRLAAPAIRRADPDAWIVTSGTAAAPEFARGIRDAGAWDDFDVLAVHTYGAPMSMAFEGVGIATREALRGLGDPGRPVWNTEFGVSAGDHVIAWGIPHVLSPREEDGDVLDRWHLRDWRDAVSLNLEERFYEVALGYQLRDGNHAARERIEREARLPRGRTQDDYGYGLLRRDGRTPRPTYRWLAEAQVNAELLAERDRSVELVLRTDEPWAAVGRTHSLRRTRDGWTLTIPDVAVGGVAPERVRIRRAEPGAGP